MKTFFRYWYGLLFDLAAIVYIIFLFAFDFCADYICAKNPNKLVLFLPGLFCVRSIWYPFAKTIQRNQLASFYIADNFSNNISTSTNKVWNILYRHVMKYKEQSMVLVLGHSFGGVQSVFLEKRLIHEGLRCQLINIYVCASFSVKEWFLRFVPDAFNKMLCDIKDKTRLMPNAKRFFAISSNDIIVPTKGQMFPSVDSKIICLGNNGHLAFLFFNTNTIEQLLLQPFMI